MNTRNIVIVVLVILVLVLAYFLFMDEGRQNQSAQNQNQNENQTVPPAVPPSVNPTPPPPPPSPNPQGPNDIAQPFSEKFADNNWLLESATLDGNKVDMNVNVPQAMTLNFEKASKKFSGFSGCNTFGGTYSASSPNKFDFGAIASTKKACPATMSLEAGVLGAMDKVTQFSIDGNGKLILQTSDGKTNLQYKEAI